MSQTVEDVLNGFACQFCGQYIDFGATGYPRSCEVCAEFEEEEE